MPSAAQQPLLTRRQALQVFGLTAAGLSATALAACSPAATASGSTAPNPSAGAGTTVSLWWQNKTAHEQGVRDGQMIDFEGKTGVKVEISIMEDPSRSLVTAFAAGTGPDTFQTDGDYPQRRQLVSGNYILQLDESYKTRKWPVFEWAKTWSSLNGAVWEMPYEAQTHGVFYNKGALKKLGQDVPKTHDDLFKVADAAKAAGLTPFTSDNKESLNVRRTLLIYQYAIFTPQQMRDIIFGDAPYASPDMLEAIERTAAVFSNGYADAKLGNTQNASEAAPAFAAGNNLFWLTFSGNAVQMKAQQESFPDLDWSYMDIPAVRSSLTSTTLGGIGSAFVVNNKAKDMEATLKLIDYLGGLDDYFNKTSIEELGFLPAVPVKTDGLQISEGTKYVIDSFAANNDIGLQVSKLWPPEMASYEAQAGAGLALGEVTPKDYMANLDALWTAAKAKPDGRWVP